MLAALSVLLSLGAQPEDVRELTLTLGGNRRALTLLAPRDDLARFPAGTVWPSGTALARALAGGVGWYAGAERYGAIARGAQVLELGCGLGAAGVAAAVAGASSVTFSDGDAAACALAARSCALDRERRRKRAESAADGAILTRRLAFEDASTWPPLGDRGGAPFDVVLGADVLYLPEAVDPLARLLEHLLPRAGADGGAAARRPRARALIADPRHGREGQAERRAQLRAAVERAGLAVTSCELDSDDAEVELLEISRA